ncbi:MAG TPA: thioredoxin domain-containing protein [Pyrinomonadaceae bacterium]|nr:thioredoxin domain-containing protein [Pyrinomonadaceae bacterium]
MKTLLFALCLFAVTPIAQGQLTTDILATAAGKNFTSASLSPEGLKLFQQQRTLRADTRTALLTKMVRSILLDLEAKARSVTPVAVLAAAPKAAEPTAAEIQSIYDANTAILGGRNIADVREELVRYIKGSREQKAEDEFYKTLEAKYKVVPGKDINSAALKPIEVITTVGTHRISVEDYERANKAALNDFEVGVYEDLRTDLKASILSVLVAEEEKERGLEPGSIFAAEVTDKLKAYTEDEKVGLELSLQKRLFAKYQAKILLKEPERFKQEISVDDDPATGSANAPVTVVMFTDFQCPACSATHPVLKRVLAEYPGKIRFVVRDYPLTDLHDRAFRAATAANAANAQGKFFEYTEILYAHQDALDDASLRSYAGSLGLNSKQFELDLNGEKAAAEVRKDIADANIYGVSWTPTIYINGIKLQRVGTGNIREAIDRALGK